MAVGQIAAAGGGLLAIKVSTNVLAPAEFGHFSAALAIAGLGQVCLFGPVAQAATRFLFVAKERRIVGAYRLSLIKQFLTGAIAIILCGLALAFTELDRLMPMPPLLVATYTLVSGLQMLQLAVINAARLRRRTASLQIADALLRPPLILFLAAIAGRSSSEVMSAYILTSLIVILLSFGATGDGRWREWLQPPAPADRSISASLFKDMSAFSWLFIVFGVLGAVGSHGERLLLIKFASWQDVGIYALMMQLALAPNLMLTSVINQYYLPMVFQSDPFGAAKLGRGYQYYLAFSIFGVAAVAASVAMLGQWLVPLFSSVAFLGHEHLLWLLALSAGIFNLGQQLVLPGMRQNRLSVYLPSKLLHSIALLCLALLLVPAWGITGMALASAVAAAVYTLSVVCANVYLAKSASLPA